jgi:hypothetical protein
VRTTARVPLSLILMERLVWWNSRDGSSAFLTASCEKRGSYEWQMNNYETGGYTLIATLSAA